MHRELQCPEIYNRPNAPIKLRIELNMSTEKSTKMISNHDEIVPVPFPFKHQEKRTILAFVNDLKLQEAAVESGAELSVGQDVVNGGLGDDLPAIIDRFRNGVKLSIKGDPALCVHRSPALGPFINRCLMMTIPGEAHLRWT
ncbi:unnamed protein product, partial [Mesorhabditis spiculigera]